MDLDADGNLDILSGSYSRTDVQPMAGLFQLLRGKPDHTFEKATVVKGTDNQPLIIPSHGQDDINESICTRPAAVDWDGDGKLDLVVGNFAGKFYWFTGTGQGKFSPAAQPILADGKPLKLKGEHSAHGDPFMIDWDGDGDLDLLSGCAAGGVQWAENTAGRGKSPTLKPFVDLIAAPKELRNECRPDDVAMPDGSTRVWAADMNGDGKLDLLVGDTIALVSPAKGVTDADFVTRRQEWQKQVASLNEELAKLQDEAKREPLYTRMSELFEKRSEFMQEDRTGFVWLYLQK